MNERDKVINKAIILSVSTRVLLKYTVLVVGKSNDGRAKFKMVVQNNSLDIYLLEWEKVLLQKNLF